MSDELDPADFADAAASAVAQCARTEGLAARGAVLAETGLLGLLAPEEVGGLGLPLRFAVPVLEAAGHGLLGHPLVESVLLAQALATPAPELAEAISTGATVVTVAWSGTAEDGVAGQAPGAVEADHVLLLRADGGAVLVPAGQLTAADDGGLDLELGTATVRVTGEVEGVELPAEAMDALRGTAKVLRAAFLTGSAARCLELAVEHADGWVQFGSPLSAFQALRHRMSRDRLAVETMRNAVLRAVGSAAGDDLARDAAWLGAAAAAPGVAESAVQVMGGMGFTWEVPVHRHLRQIRSVVAHGDAGGDLSALGARLLEGTTNEWYRDLAHAG
ncbi:acyl-CoA dehydrogenase family protein [Klenkia sp. LSe6-5]|uniref:Acyl-CoA dehydrogenase family protein n=1 Tax=Klenkia sesuvii TaxID=3103137 RepID=A0ABU8DYW5_9ACTN